MSARFTALALLALLVTEPTVALSQTYGQAPATYGQAQADPFAGDPTVHEAIEAGTRRVHLRVAEINGYRNRAGWSAVMPQVDVAFRTNDSSIDLERYDFVTFPDRVAGQDTGTADAMEIQVSAGWDLSRVVFNPLVLDVNSMVSLYDEIMQEVVSFYFLRQRLVLSLVNNPPDDPASRQSMALRIAQATATLNALTGGLFEDSRY